MDKIFFTFNLINAQENDQIPDWIQLTLAGEFMAVDGRGPFVVDEAAILAAARERGKLAVDINHAIDRRGSVGEPSPAVGWIVELAARVDGIWGRVEWTEAGKQALFNKEYVAISPVLIATGENPAIVVEIARASLCNDPGLPQLKSLFNRNGDGKMDKELRAALSLPEDAKDEAVLEAVKLVRDRAEKAEAMTAQHMAADVEKVDLEKQIASLNAKLVEITQAQAKEKAEAFVNKAIEAFQIVPSLKDHFINRHMKEPEAVEKEIAAMPVLMTSSLRDYQPDGKGDGLSADERRVCQLMGVDAAKFAESKTQNKELV